MKRHFFVGLFLCVSNIVAMESMRFKEAVSHASLILKENGYSDEQIEDLKNFKKSDILKAHLTIFSFFKICLPIDNVYRLSLRDNTYVTAMIIEDNVVTVSRDIDVNVGRLELPINPDYFWLIQKFYHQIDGDQELPINPESFGFIENATTLNFMKKWNTE